MRAASVQGWDGRPRMDSQWLRQGARGEHSPVRIADDTLGPRCQCRKSYLLITPPTRPRGQINSVQAEGIGGYAA
jgi:hypothetical protein